SSSSTTSATDVVATPVEFLGCHFEDNLALEDGGAMYSIAEYDIVRDCTFIGNRAESSGGALVHAGVITEMSSTVFEGNDAGN
ncbi:unnamed protein product, partial [Ectocarpus sp. 12 AP-2014]